MRFTNYFIPTYKEIPADAEVISHQLMLRAGMIRKLSAGIYTFMPIGLKAVRRVENIVREEMNRSGAIEVLMPAVQPAEIWKESGRWDFYGKELLRFKDRHNHDCCLGPTHEEVITDVVRKEIRSYRQLPVNLYQIQTKFRDEIRPRFGVMRCKEFIMKDAYSFDVGPEGADKSYEIMYDAYTRIFTRCGLKFRAVEADSGSIGGSYSHEFMVLADTGEDEIVNCTSCAYAANLEKAEVKAPAPEATPGPAQPLEEVETPDVRTIDELSSFLSVPPDQIVKTLIFTGDGKTVAVLIRGDHEVNEAKLKNLLVADELALADPGLVAEVTGAPMGFAGPVGLKTRIIADHAVKPMVNFVTGGNKEDLHFRNVNLERDFSVERFADLRVIKRGDRCPRCNGEINFGRGIEVGHVFKLGTKYSKSMHAVFLDEQGEEKFFFMGCYGIGIARTVAAAIEQNHDREGMILPVSIAPFEAVVLPLQLHEAGVPEAAEGIYQDLRGQGFDVLLDDRDLRPGVKFKDADLLGIPVRINVGARNLKDGYVEMKLRTEAETVRIPVRDAAKRVAAKIKELYDSIK
ncbi:MAG: proline--tRNA ligase [Desulfobacterota bacterium]|jgi:prolyl-tRNA synthetase|nr:proline--tRNA ligase [Thermodesulfobacteriota bacterium]